MASPYVNFSLQNLVNGQLILYRSSDGALINSDPGAQVPPSTADTTTIIENAAFNRFKGIKVAQGLVLIDGGTFLRIEPPAWTEWFPTWGNGDPSLNFGTMGITATQNWYRKTYDVLEFRIMIRWSPTANASIATINLPNNNFPNSFYSNAQPVYCAEIIHDPRTGGTARLFGAVSFNFVAGVWNMVIESSQTGEAGLARQEEIRGIYRTN